MSVYHNLKLHIREFCCWQRI